MQFHLQNLGLIRDAKIELGQLTIVCGKNNTGKSYLTHSLYGALAFARRQDRFYIPKDAVDAFRERGFCSVNLVSVASKYWEGFCADEMHQLSTSVPGLLGKPNVAISTLAINLDVGDLRSYVEGRLRRFSCDFPLKFNEGYSVQFTKKKDSEFIECKYVPTQAGLDIYQGVHIDVPDLAVENTKWVVSYLICQRLPRPFIIGSERTGISVFRDEFNFYRTLAYNEKGSEQLDKLRERVLFNDYPIAVRKDLEFATQLSTVVKNKKSFLADRQPLLQEFASIAGGDYEVDSNSGLVSFHPNGSSERLSLRESSSSVRSLCELYFYFQYCARRGDILIIDEPEMNLHPGAQRQLARFIAALLKQEIRVFITTHSDYLIREFNAMVRISKLDDESQKVILQKYNYKKDSLVADDDLRVYVVNAGGANPVSYDVEAKAFGVTSFDDTIETYNQLFTDIRNLD